MPWGPDEAARLCGDLLQSLINAMPQINWEKADAHGDDGLIYFTNSQGKQVKVKISREALADYEDTDDRNKSRKEAALAQHFARINNEGLTDALLRSEHLAP